MVGDLNRDGKLDVAVASVLDVQTTSTGNLDVFLGKGDGTFQSRQEFTPLPGGLVFNSGPRLRDFNGDGLLDIVSVAGYTTGQPHDLAVALNTDVKRDPRLGFLLQVNSTLGTADPVVLEASTDLVTWTALSTNATITGLWSVIDPATNLQQRYYRTRRVAPALSDTGQPKP